jgi:hypothetical protein
MHFKPKIYFCIVFIQIRQHREICRGEKICAKVYFLLLLEEKITAAAESRGVGCSLFARFSIPAGLERSEKTTTSLPFRSRQGAMFPPLRLLVPSDKFLWEKNMGFLNYRA